MPGAFDATTLVEGGPAGTELPLGGGVVTRLEAGAGPGAGSPAVEPGVRTVCSQPFGFPQEVAGGQAPVAVRVVGGQVPVAVQVVGGQVPVSAQVVGGQVPVSVQPGVGGQVPVSVQVGVGGQPAAFVHGVGVVEPLPQDASPPTATQLPEPVGEPLSTPPVELPPGA